MKKIKIITLIIIILNLFLFNISYGGEMTIQKYNFQTKSYDPPKTIQFDDAIGPIGVDPTRDLMQDPKTGKFETGKEKAAREEKEYEQKSEAKSSDSGVGDSSSQASSKTQSKSCEKYKKEADKDYLDYCNNIESCNIYNPTDIGQSIIKIQTIPFTPVALSGSAAGTSLDAYGELYMDYLTNILNSAPYIGVKPFEQAKAVYVETQNAIYNCAVLRVKLKVGENIIKLVKNNNSTNIVQKIESQNQTIKNELTQKKCNTPGKKEISYKEVLVNNLTYHYCNYRFYLNYLANFPSYNVTQTTISSKIQKPGQDRYNTQHVSNNLRKQSNLVDKEILHVNQVYNLSFSAFSELENTYGLHVMLLLIYDDYVQIRKNLAKILNPVSQLLYKIPEAQCHSGCK